MSWTPKQGLFSDIELTLIINWDVNWPIKNPEVRWYRAVPIHPNFYKKLDGEICLDILQDQYVPTYTFWGILISIEQLIDNPEHTSPANYEASKAWLKD